MGKRCKCEVCGAHYSARVGHTCLADASPTGCADVKPVEVKAPQRSRISAADRRSVETALLRGMPVAALEARRDQCEQMLARSITSEVWHVWHHRLQTVRDVLDALSCPPPRSRGRDMPSVDTPLCSCGALAAPHDILCVDCAARADANIACLRELESQDVPADDYADLVDEVKSILSPSSVPESAQAVLASIPCRGCGQPSTRLLPDRDGVTPVCNDCAFTV